MLWRSESYGIKKAVVLLSLNFHFTYTSDLTRFDCFGLRRTQQCARNVSQNGEFSLIDITKDLLFINGYDLIVSRI